MAQQNQLDTHAYQNYQKFTGTLEATIENKLQDTTTLTNTRSPSFLQTAYKNVAMLVLSLAAAYSTPVFAQDIADAGTPKPAAEQKDAKDTPKKEEPKDLDKLTAEQLITAGKDYFTKGDYKTAVQAYQKAIEKQPTAEAYLRQGLALYKTGELDKALESFKKGKGLPNALHFDVVFKNDDAKKLYLSAGKELANKKYESALKLLQEADTVEPNNPAILYQRAAVFLNQKKYPEAINVLQTALQLDTSFTRAYGLTATTYYEAGDFAQALFFYRCAKELDTASSFREFYSGRIVELEKKMSK
jgi:tetratricopeptide (TPR) repeat protein